MNLLTELRRRNVFRVTAAYLVVGWLLTEVLTTILPTIGAPDWTARAVILVFALGFVPTVTLSWVYQITPDGIVRDSDARATQGRHSVSHAFDYVVIASVVMLVFTLAIMGSQLDAEQGPAPTASLASVAVLPFQDLSPEKDHEYLADGLTETLLHMLTQVPGLQVAARTSSFAFKGKNMDVTDIADQLHVAHILEGTIQRSGDKVRVTAQLTSAADGYQIFSTTFDRKIDDIFAIQDEIAIKVREELAASILGTGTLVDAASAGTQNAEAYDLYLQAVSETASRSFRGLQAAERLLKGALAIDPGYLDAKSELAYNYLRQFESGLMAADAVSPEIDALIGQVLEERPQDPGARAIVTYVNATAALATGPAVDARNAIPQLEALFSAQPSNSRTRSLLGRLLRRAGDFERAVEIQRKALELDPLNAEIYYELGSVLELQGKPADAREALEKSLELESGQPQAYVRLANLSRADGDGVEYVRQLLGAMQADAQDPDIAGALGAFMYRLGLLQEGDEFRDRVLAIAPTSEAAYRLERIRALAAGDPEGAVSAARRAVENDIDNRHGGFARAVGYLLHTAVLESRVEEEMAYLETVAPGTLEGEATRPKAVAARIAALDAWYVTLPADQVAGRIASLRNAADALPRNPFANTANDYRWAALEGRRDEATRALLDNTLTQTVLLHLDWPETAPLPQYAYLENDAEVTASVSRWQKELAAERDRVTQFLAGLTQ
ncbi:MAG: tetratricopeptide repeat protein [Pseudomonadota bacterium]